MRCPNCDRDDVRQVDDDLWCPDCGYDSRDDGYVSCRPT